MDQRSHNPHAPHPHPDDAHAPVATAPRPWPAPLGAAQHAPARQQQPPAPTMQQFAQAGSGFVLPGAPAGYTPMSSHDGTIGSPLAGGASHPHPHGFPYPPAAPHPQAAPHPHPLQVGQLAPQVQAPSAWAFPTPQGLQLVQPGATAMAAVAPPAAPLVALPGGEQHAVATRRRLRWETIVPGAAVLCLLAAAAFFVADFDRMTGRDGAAPSTRTAPASSGAGAVAVDPVTGAASEADTAQAVADAATRADEGNYDGALELLHPLLLADAPDETVVALAERIDAQDARNTALIQRLTRERGAKQWTAAIATIDQIEAMHPLSPGFVRMRTQARTLARSARAVAQATSLMRSGRLSAAATVIDKALASGRDARLESMREQLAALRARPAAATPSGDGPSASGGGAPAMPPTSGGSGTAPGASAPAARPPANVPAGSIPQLPEGGNPITTGAGTGAVGGQPAATGGGTVPPAAEMACLRRTARHGAEDHAGMDMTC